MATRRKPKKRSVLTPRELGAERRQLAKRRESEFAHREREYKKAFAGSLAPAAKAVGPKKAGEAAAPAGAPAAAAAKRAPPLKILAEGDSWFDYPAHAKGGIIPRLSERLGIPILSLAKAGDEVRYMLGVEERKELRKHLIKGGPGGTPWDVLLFSGGGNDIVDNPMALWVREYEKNKPPRQLIHQPRFDSALALVRAGYEDLIALRDAHSPTTRLVFHTYDFAIPSGDDVCFFGPWLQPTFKLRGFPNFGPASDAALVVRAMLEQFAEMLGSLAGARIRVINGQGTLPNARASWHNELHPAAKGFDDFAARFHAELKALFPGRVP